MSVKFTNNGKTTLSASVAASDTSISVSDASVLPSISGSEYFYLTLQDTSGDLEVVKVTAVSSNTLTVTRAQEGTTAIAFASGDKAENRLTAGGLNDVSTQADTNTDTTYTAGSGLSLSGTEFSNSAPDQTVSITGSGATSVSGTYPNFTISSTDTDTNTTYSVGDGGLTEKNFTTALKGKLDGIESGAEVNVNADWNASSGDAQILNKPSIPSLSGYATETYVDTAVSDLVDSAPSTLDTLNELAAALGDDANFSTTVTNSIATKLPLAGGTLTGNLGIGGAPDSDSGLHLKGDGKRLLIDSDDYNLVSLGRSGSSGAGLDVAYFRMKNAGTNTVVINAGGDSYFNGGNVLVGTTNTGANHASDGAYITEDGQLIGRATGIVSYLNRRGSDGQILQFMKDGSQVGSIDVANGDLNINGDTGIRFQASSLMPRSGGSDADATVDLGLSSHRWKDLYLSGTASMSNGHATGKFAVKSTGVHGSYDFYNNGTSYFNGSVTVDDNLYLTTGKKLVLPSAHTKQKIEVYGGGDEWIGTSANQLELSGAGINLNGGQGTGTPNLKMGGTTVIDSSRNLSNIGNATFSGNVTIDQGTSGDASLTIRADTDNNNENDHPSIRFKQDGDLVDWRIGIGRTDTDTSGNASNSLFVTHLAGTADGFRYSTDGTTSYKIWHEGNDGSGSGLDADTVDGVQASSFLRSDTNDSINAGTIYTFGTSNTEGLRFTNSSYNKSLYIGGWTTSNTAGISRIRNSNDNLHLDSGANGNLYLNHYSSGTVYANGQEVWHAGNDGSGSGLDADKLDGLQASSFLRSDADDQVSTYSNNIRFYSNTAIESTGSSQASLEVYQPTAGSDAFMAFHVAGDYAGYFGLDGSDNQFKIGGWSFGGNKYKVWHQGNDGSGSGLDADTLDGVQGSSYLRSDQNDTHSGNIQAINLDLTANHGRGLRFWNGSDSYRIYMSSTGQSGAGRVAGETTSDYNMYFRMTGGTNRGFVFQNGNGNKAGIDASGNIRTVANVDCNYLRADRIYSNNDGSSGYFYNDSGTRTAYKDGDFYLQTSVSNYYNYATNIYLGNTSGDIIRFRGNQVSHNGFSIDSDGDLTTTRDIVVNARNRSCFGVYSSYHTDQIWSMGTAYRNHSSGTNFGNLYGLAYKHTNNSTGGTMAGSHQMVWCQNGSPKAALGTNIWTSGNVTAYSDIRVKTNIERIPDALDKVCQLNGYTFDRTDVTLDEQGEPTIPIRQTGVIAQEVLEVLPEAVTGDEEGHYSVAYGNMVGLLIESVKELKAEIDDLKAQLEAKQ